MRLGCCYYPEHWPEDWWARDAREMVELGLSRVRIGEFAWSRIEPQRGRYDWGWLDRAIATLGNAGLGVILGTPTATPPKRLVDEMPDMLPVGADGMVRGFGSRRHYCFSHPGYRAEAARITEIMAARYGKHPAVIAWQTDNEYGCHDTAISYSRSARDGFRSWVRDRYADVATLDAAWGTIFWSQEYGAFDEIELPYLAVTECNPAHVLDFRRYSSEQVVAFNRAQVEIIRKHSPGRAIVHNFMGFFTQFDHHDVAADLDVATWDSYPLGFLEQFWFGSDDKRRFARQGHPDIAAFHHDLYRGVGRGRWWVMEQQPGPVNWARWNPAPLPGMVRLWTLEALAHGAELVSYFRWRQVPFGQEQLHAGLQRPDRSFAAGAEEVRQAGRDIAVLGDVPVCASPVALLFSYEASWVCETQPHGKDFSWLELVFECYSALRQCGIDVDILPADAPLDGYRAVVIPCLPIVDDSLVDRLRTFDGAVLIGPRTGSKRQDFRIPDDLPPGPLQRLIPIKITYVESLRPSVDDVRWREHIEADDGVVVEGDTWRHGRTRYLAAWPGKDGLHAVIARFLADAGLSILDLGSDVRVRSAGDLHFAFNYGPDTCDLAGIAPDDADFVLGSAVLPPTGVSVWKRR